MHFRCSYCRGSRGRLAVDGHQIRRAWRRSRDSGAEGSRRARRELVLGDLPVNNEDPKPFAWSKTADDILASIERFCLQTLNHESSGSLKDAAKRRIIGA